MPKIAWTIVLACVIASVPLAPGQSPPWPEWLQRFAAGDESARQQFFTEYRLHLDDAAWTLRLAMAQAKAAGESGSLEVLDRARAVLARRFPAEHPLARELQAVWIETTDEVARVAILTAAEAERAHFEAPDAASAERVRAARAALSPHLRDDRQLRRFALGLDLAIAEGAARSAALDALIQRIDADGLSASARGLRARVARARNAIGRGDLATAAKDLSRLRSEGIAAPDVPLLLRTRAAALTLEHGRLSGDWGEFFSVVEELESTLLPALAEVVTLNPEADPGLADELAAYETGIAHWLASFGAHARASGIIQRARERVRDDELLRAKLALLASQLAEASGDLDAARSEALVAKRSLESLAESTSASSDAEASALQALLRWQAELALFGAALHSGDAANASEARAAIGEVRSAARAIELPLALETDRQRLATRDHVLAAVDADLRDDLAAAMREIEAGERIASGLPPTAEWVQLAWMRARAEWRRGSVDAALSTAEDAVRRAEAAVEDAAWLRGHADVVLAELQLRLGRHHAARRTLLDAMDRLPVEIEAARPALAAEMRRLAAQAVIAARGDETSQGRAQPADLENLLAPIFERFERDASRGAVEPSFLAEVLRAELDLAEHTARRTSEERRHEVLQAALHKAERAVKLSGTPSMTSVGLMAILRARTARAAGEERVALQHYREALNALTPELAHTRAHLTDGRTPAIEGFEREALAFTLQTAAATGDRALAERALFLREELGARDFARLRAARLAAAEEGPLLDLAPSRGAAKLRAPEARRRMLPAGRALLAYSVFEHETYALLARQSGTIVRRIPIGASRLEALARSLRRTLAAPADPHRWSSFLRDGRELHQALIAPFAAELAAVEELAILPDGALHDLPFSALPASDATGADGQGVRFLAEMPGLSALTITPSAALLDPARQALPWDDGAIVLAGDYGDLGPGFPALAHAGRELDAIAARLAGRSVQVLRGQDGAWSRIAPLLAGKIAILHVITHGDETACAEGQPALVLPAEDSASAALRLSQDLVLEVPFGELGLVVLSACQSARGRPIGLEGTLGLPRAFLVAGAHSVLAATPPVGDADAATLMAAFYDQLAAGERRPAAALLAAQRALLQGASSRWPGAWGGFVLVGSPGR